MNILTSDEFISHVEKIYKDQNAILWDQALLHLQYYFTKLKEDCPELKEAVFKYGNVYFYNYEGNQTPYVKYKNNINLYHLNNLILYILYQNFAKEYLLKEFTLT